MPQLKHKISEYQLQGLHHTLEKQLGHSIRDSAGVKKLHSALHDTTGQSLSFSTLYRLFLQPSRKHLPYLSTLDILVSFCGYDGWNTFEVITDEADYLTKEMLQQKDLVYINLTYGYYKALREYLAQFDDHTPKKTRYEIGASLFRGFAASSDNTAAFEQLSDLFSVRNFFFELYADPTFSLPNYDYGLQQYLINNNPEHSVEDVKDFLFVNCLRFRNRYINNSQEVIPMGQALYSRNFLQDISKQDSFFHWPTTRYIAYKVFYLESTVGQKATEGYFHESIEEITEKINYWQPEEKEIALHTWMDTIQLSQHLNNKHLTLLNNAFQSNDNSNQRHYGSKPKNPNLSVRLQQKLIHLSR